MLFKGKGEIIKKAWICKDCSLSFQKPMANPKTKDWYCPYCGSRRIEKAPSKHKDNHE